MKWIIYATIFCLIMVIILIRKGRKDTAKEPSAGTIIRYPEEEEMFNTPIGDGTYLVFPQDNRVIMSIMDEILKDEFSPKNSISDETIKRVVLRNKLNKIEEEREIKDINLDYSREDGK